MSKQLKDLSIIIVSWNTKELTCECIESIYKYLNSSFSFEIIVVDNASSDDTVVAVTNLFPEVNLVKNEENLGFAVAVNQGVSLALGRYLLLLNSDARFLDNSLEILLQAIETDDSIGVVAGGMVTSGGRKVKPYFGFPSLSELLKSYSLDLIYKVGKGMRGRERKSMLTADGHRLLEVDWVSGAYLLARRELMDGNELLDCRIFMYFEDTLLCKKAWDSGYRVVCFDDLEIFHKGGASAKKTSFLHSMYAYQSSLIYMEEMHGKTAVWWYERVMRLVWYSLIPALFFVGLFGYRQNAREKREIFKSFLSIPLSR